MLSQYNFRQALLIIIFHVLCIVCYAQQDYTSNYNVDVPNMPFLSPEAASLGKYGEIPVSEYTGVPQIEIPLYTVKSGELELPISLSYHASGIKVNQEATWVGLGWDLMAGGCINRIISGELDEKYYGFQCSVDHVKQLFQDYHDTEPHTFEHLGYFQEYSYMNLSLLDELKKHNLEPDFFQANFLGHSFVFYIDPFTREVVTTGKESGNYKVQVIYNNATISEWIVTDNMGIEYYFENQGIEIAHKDSYQQGYISTWFITKIKHPIKGEITIQFEDSSHRIYVTPSLYEYRTKGKKVGQENSCIAYGNVQIVEPGISGINDTGVMQVLSSYEPIINKRYITKISTETEELSLWGSESRIDINGLKLDSIIITSTSALQSSSKRIKFNYSYFVGNNSTEESALYNLSHNHKTYRLRLDTVSVNDQKYIFTYNTETSLPRKTSYDQDFWGYYNGAHNNSLLASLQYDSTVIGYANRFVNDNTIQAGILQSIKYPTGGLTKFEFEPNTFTDLIFNERYPLKDKPFDGNSYGGGLRIKRIINIDSTEDSKITNVKEFLYEKFPGETSGLLLLPLPFVEKDIIKPLRVSSENNGGIILSHDIWETNTLASSVSAYPLVSLNLSPVGYSKVTIREYDKTTISTYYNNPPWMDRRSHKGTWLDNYYNGLIKEKNIYSTDNILFQKQEWKYECLVDSTTTINAYARDYCGCSVINVNGLHPFDRYRITVYPIYTQRIVPTKHIKQTRYGNSFVCDTTLYFYNDSTYLLSRMCKSSDIPGQYQIYDIKYPSDNVSYHNACVLRNMIDRNMLAYPVETKLTFNGNIIERNRNVFSNNLIGNDSIPVLTERQWAQGVRDFKTRLKIAYDSHGNFVEVRKNDGKPISFLWGYNWSLPVAVIDGVSYNSISNNTKEVIGSINGTYLGQQLENLASQYTSGKFYTYDTLVGITSELSANGYKVYYGYDSFGRLSLMYDILGSPQNPLKRFEYNYAH